MHAHAIVGEFLFWLVPKKYAKESALSWKESNLENKSLNYKKGEKLTFEISFWVTLLQNYFCQKMRVCVRQGNFF